MEAPLARDALLRPQDLSWLYRDAMERVGVRLFVVVCCLSDPSMENKAGDLTLYFTTH